MTLTATVATPIDAIAMRAALDRLDHTAREMERKWGVGRLRLLVDDVLRAKFDRQLKLLDEALWGEPGSVDGRTIVSQIDATERGWLALDRTATAAGHTPKPPGWVEALSPGGQLYLIVTDNADASQISEHARGRQAQVFTGAEVGRLLEAWPQIATVKATFEGARVTDVRVKRPVDWEHGDDIPW
jgi:hypothetical protein